MKKTLLSSVVVVSFIAYAFYDHWNNPVIETGARTNSQGTPIQKTSSSPPPPAPQVIPRTSGSEDDGEENERGGLSARSTPSAKTPTPALPPASTPPPAGSTQARGIYKDGSYTSPTFDVFYGNVQLRAIVSHGRLTDVQFLQYPNDRGTSIQINSEAMPMLVDEALTAQNASVDIVSGATQTSKGFIAALHAILASAQ